MESAAAGSVEENSSSFQGSRWPLNVLFPALCLESIAIACESVAQIRTIRLHSESAVVLPRSQIIQANEFLPACLGLRTASLME